MQLDCDPPEITYQILLTIPFDAYKFRVITFEHDYYTDTNKTLQERSIKYLESYGYVRVVNNIAPDDWRSYEDWWVHPDLVDMDYVNEVISQNADLYCEGVVSGTTIYGPNIEY